MSIAMIDPPDASQWSSLFVLVEVAAGQDYIPLHEDALVVYSDVEDMTDAVKLAKSHNPRKRALSLGSDYGNSFKRVNDSAGRIIVTSSVSEGVDRIKPGKELYIAAEHTVPTSTPGPRRTKPLPKRTQGNPESLTSVPDLDISWIPQSYRNSRKKVPDTRMHKLFLSQCSYLLPEYYENGGLKKRNQDERKAFLNADEWVEVHGGYDVRCKGCKSDILLDPREGKYYANLWMKHRSRCPGVYKAWLERNGWSPSSDPEWFRNKKIVQSS
ncbi:hypothetical protein F5146DRAFT_1130473 [Armillaria mellea]|nr:hypothetical protein F5146DRAFT_1130473 [Armillaria mellea]